MSSTHRALEKELVRVDLRDRTRTDEVRAVQARAGDHDLLDLVSVPGVIVLLRLHGERKCPRDAGRDKPGPRLGFLHGVGLHGTAPGTVRVRQQGLNAWRRRCIDGSTDTANRHSVSQAPRFDMVT